MYLSHDKYKNIKILNSNVTTEEIQKAAKDLKYGKASGPVLEKQIPKQLDNATPLYLDGPLIHPPLKIGFIKFSLHKSG
jgi:hypothetical protein